MNVKMDDVKYLDNMNMSNYQVNRRLFSTEFIFPVTLTTVHVSEYPEYRNNATLFYNFLSLNLEQAVYSGKASRLYEVNLRSMGVIRSIYPAIIAVYSGASISMLKSPTHSPSINSFNGIDANSLFTATRITVFGVVFGFIGLVCISGFVYFASRRIYDRKKIDSANIDDMANFLDIYSNNKSDDFITFVSPPKNGIPSQLSNKETFLELEKSFPDHKYDIRFDIENYYRIHKMDKVNRLNQKLLNEKIQAKVFGNSSDFYSPKIYDDVEVLVQPGSQSTDESIDSLHSLEHTRMGNIYMYNYNYSAKISKSAEFDNKENQFSHSTSIDSKMYSHSGEIDSFKVESGDSSPKDFSLNNLVTLQSRKLYFSSHDSGDIIGVVCNDDIDSIDNNSSIYIESNSKVRFETDFDEYLYDEYEPKGDFFSVKNIQMGRKTQFRSVLKLDDPPERDHHRTFQDDLFIDDDVNDKKIFSFQSIVQKLPPKPLLSPQRSNAINMYDIYPDKDPSSIFEYTNDHSSTNGDISDNDEIDGTRFLAIKHKFESMIKKNTQSLLLSPIAKKRLNKNNL